MMYLGKLNNLKSQKIKCYKYISFTQNIFIYTMDNNFWLIK